MSNGTHFRQDRQRGQRPDGPGSQGYSYPDAPDAVCSFFELYGEFDQLQDLDDDQRGSVEWAVFKDWAERRGNCRDSSFGGFTGEGGHEHEVVKHDGYYLKRTRWTKSGLTYDVETKQILPATISEYLFRLAWQDFFFKTKTAILGLAEEAPFRYAIVTRQEEVTGRAPSEREMKDCLDRIGFELVVAPPCGPVGGGGALYLFDNLFYIADVRTDNCLVFPCDNDALCLTAWDFFIAPVDEKARKVMIDMLRRFYQARA